MIKKIFIIQALIFFIISSSHANISDDLMKHGYVTHLTRWNPIETDFTLHAGCTNTHHGHNVVLQDSFRPCLYFSLNNVAPEHDNWDRSSRKFGYILPISAIRDSLVNLYPTDLAAWIPRLDVKEIDGAVVFLPKSCEDRDIDSGKAKIMYVDTDMPTALTTYLNENKIPLLIKNPGPVSTQESFLIKGHENIDLGKAASYETFLAEHPYISFGHEEHPYKTGLGSWVAFFSYFIDQLQRETFTGPYASQMAQFQLSLRREKKIFSTYSPNTYLAMAKVAFEDIKALIKLVKNDAVKKDFFEIQGPKIEDALTLFKEEFLKWEAMQDTLDPQIGIRFLSKFNTESFTKLLANKLVENYKGQLKLEFEVRK